MVSWGGTARRPVGAEFPFFLVFLDKISILRELTGEGKKARDIDQLNSLGHFPRLFCRHDDFVILQILNFPHKKSIGVALGDRI